MTTSARPASVGVLCLCCATRYDADGDCPHVDELPHSIEIAVSVSRYLLDSGCHHPHAGDVRNALIALGSQK